MPPPVAQYAPPTGVLGGINDFAQQTIAPFQGALSDPRAYLFPQNEAERQASMNNAIGMFGWTKAGSGGLADIHVPGQAAAGAKAAGTAALEGATDLARPSTVVHALSDESSQIEGGLKNRIGGAGSLGVPEAGAGPAQTAAQKAAVIPADSELAAQVAKREADHLRLWAIGENPEKIGPRFGSDAFPQEAQPALAAFKDSPAYAEARMPITLAEQKASAEAITDPIWKVADDVRAEVGRGQVSSRVQYLNDEVANLVSASTDLGAKVANGTATEVDRLAYATTLKSAFVGRMAAVEATSEAARTLGATGRIPVGSASSPTSRTILDIINNVTKNHPEKLDEIASYVATIGNEPKKLIALARTLGTQPSKWDKFYEYYRANVLWNVATHVTNTVSGVYQVGLHSASTTIAPTFEAAASIASLGKYQRRAYFSDIPTYWRGLMKGYAGIFEDLPNQLSHSEISDKYGGAIQFPYGAIGGPVGTAIRLPFKALSMADLFQTKPLYNAMLDVYAQREGLKKGLSGAKLADFVNNLSPETFAKVEQAARDTSENVALHSSSPLGRAIIQLREASPLMALNILFVQTPLNIAKLGLRYSPAGPLRLLTEGGRADPAGVLREATIGAGVTAGFLSLLNTDNMTGLTPKSTAEKSLWEAEGRAPMSIRASEYPMLGPVFRMIYGDRADKTWVTTNYLGPLQYPALIAAGAHEATAQGADVTPAHAVAAAGAVGQTMLGTIPLFQSYSGISNLLSNPSVAAAERFIANFAKPLIPAETGQAMVERMTDVYRRDPQTLMDYFKAVIPGVGKEVQPKQDVLGRDIEQPTGAQAMLGRATQERIDDPVGDAVLAEDARLRDTNQNFTGLTKVTNSFGSGTTKVDLTPAQEYQYQHLAGNYQKDILGQLIQTPEYQKASTADKTKLWDNGMSAAKERAKVDLLVDQVSKLNDPTMRTQLAAIASTTGTNYTSGSALEKMQLSPEIISSIDASRSQPDPKKLNYQPAVAELIGAKHLVDAWTSAPEFLYGTPGEWASAARARSQLLVLQKKFPPEKIGNASFTDPRVLEFWATAADGNLALFYTRDGSRKSNLISEERKTIEQDPLWKYATKPKSAP